MAETSSNERINPEDYSDPLEYIAAMRKQLDQLDKEAIEREAAYQLERKKNSNLGTAATVGVCGVLLAACAGVYMDNKE